MYILGDRVNVKYKSKVCDDACTHCTYIVASVL